MKNFTLSGNRWFDGLNQPALLADSGTVLYYNAAARELFRSDGISLSDGGPLPAPLSELTEDGATELLLGGQRWSLLVQSQEAGTLYLLTSMAESSLDYNARIASQLNTRLQRLTAASEGIQMRLGEFLTTQHETWLARENQSIYQLTRLGQLMEFMGLSDDELRLLYPSGTVELVEILGNVEPLLADLGHELGRSFTFQFAMGEYYSDINESLLRLAIYNLAANSFQAEGDVVLKLKRQGSHALLLLSDNGKGIPPQKYASLFSSAYQPLALHETGLGLGLAVCQRIAALYGGRLVVSPRKPGTLVTMSLPLNHSKCGVTLRTVSLMSMEEARIQALTELSDILPVQCYRPE